MNDKLVVTVIVRYAQFIRELTAVGLNNVGNTSTERTFNAGQFFKHFITGGMTSITQPLLVHFVRVLSKYSTRCAASVNKLISNIVRTIRIRSDLTDNYSVNAQCGPCSWLYFLRTTRLLWQTSAI